MQAAKKATQKVAKRRSRNITRTMTPEARQASTNRLVLAREALAKRVRERRPEFVPPGCKFCGRCGFIKFRGSFSNHRNMSDGKQTVCKDCTSLIPTTINDTDVWLPGQPLPDQDVAETYTEPRRTKEEMAQLRLAFSDMMTNGPTRMVERATTTEPTITASIAVPSEAATSGNGLMAFQDGATTKPDTLGYKMTNPLTPITMPNIVYPSAPTPRLAAIGSGELIRKELVVHAIIDGTRLQITLVGGNTIVINGTQAVETYRWLAQSAELVSAGKTEVESLRVRIIELEETLRQRESVIAANRRDVDSALELASEATRQYNDLVQKIGPLADALKAVQLELPTTAR